MSECFECVMGRGMVVFVNYCYIGLGKVLFGIYYMYNIILDIEYIEIFNIKFLCVFC